MKMDMTATLTSALEGLQVGVNQARQAAGEVAKLTTGSKDVQDVVRPLLRLNDSEPPVAVTSEIVKGADDNLGRFVDETV